MMEISGMPFDWILRAYEFQATKPRHIVIVWMNKTGRGFIDDVRVVRTGTAP